MDIWDSCLKEVGWEGRVNSGLEFWVLIGIGLSIGNVDSGIMLPASELSIRFVLRRGNSLEGRLMHRFAQAV